jgi:hypothetical protein
MFSFGIVMWEIMTGEEPYANMHYGATIRQLFGLVSESGLLMIVWRCIGARKLRHWCNAGCLRHVGESKQQWQWQRNKHKKNSSCFPKCWYN